MITAVELMIAEARWEVSMPISYSMERAPPAWVVWVDGFV